MKKIFSMQDFINLFPKHASTVRHFINSRGRRVISGKAELFDCGHVVEYFHDLFNGLFTILYQGIVLYSEEVYSPEEINEAFRKADEEFFLNMFRPASYDEVPLLETDKGRRCMNYETSKKAIKNDHRGQHGRWMHRKASKGKNGFLKTGSNCRFRGKSVQLFDFSEIEQEDYFEFPSNASNSKHYDKGSNYLFLAEGMNVLIETDGTVGALSFNSNYLGCRIIHAA